MVLHTPGALECVAPGEKGRSLILLAPNFLRKHTEKGSQKGKRWITPNTAHIFKCINGDNLSIRSFSVGLKAASSIIELAAYFFSSVWKKKSTLQSERKSDLSRWNVCVHPPGGAPVEGFRKTRTGNIGVWFLLISLLLFPFSSPLSSRIQPQEVVKIHGRVEIPTAVTLVPNSMFELLSHRSGANKTAFCLTPSSPTCRQKT